MEKDVLELLKQSHGEFSKGQRRIAQYIRDNYDKAAFMTAGKLGETVGVSESTVVRFAADLGFDGYPGMRKAMQEMVRNRLTSVQRIEVAEEYINESNALESVLCADRDKLQNTLDEVDHESFKKAVDMLIHAKHIYIVGMRSSTCLANFLGFYLNLLLENVHIVQDTTVSEVYEQIVRIREGDLFVGISYPRYCSRTIKAMRFARTTGASVLGITDGPASPFVGLADTLLYAKSDMVSFLDSLVAPLSLINALIVSVGMSTRENTSEVFTRLEKIWADYEVYEKHED